MLSWLRQVFTPSHRRPSAEALLEAARRELEADAAWDQGRARRLTAALEGLCSGDSELVRERLLALQGPFARWCVARPFEVVWSRDYGFRVVDPMVTTDAAITGEEAPTLRPWASLLRTLEILSGGPNLFHHGCDLGAVLTLLADPWLPRRILKFSWPSLQDCSAGEIDALVAVMCEDPRFAALEHLAIRTAAPIEPRHVELLAAAPWAATLRTLDLTETMIDWSVDVADGPRHAALRALRRFTGLTHLVLYNDIHVASDLEVLLEAPLASLTHLALGHGPEEAAALDVLATTRSLPQLQELCLSGGPARTDPAWDRALGASFPIYLHGRRVSAEYPCRT
jgi:hypothetical protein